MWARARIILGLFEILFFLQYFAFEIKINNNKMYIVVTMYIKVSLEHNSFRERVRIRLGLK